MEQASERDRLFDGLPESPRAEPRLMTSPPELVSVSGEPSGLTARPAGGASSAPLRLELPAMP